MVTFQRRYHENIKLQKIAKFVADTIIVIVLAYTLILFTCSRTTIIGNSMQPTIENGDTVLINQMAYSFHKPNRYSLVAFKLSGIENSKLYVKRIVGLPGETIQIKEGKVFINGETLEDDAIEANILTAGIAINEIKLDEDEYFVLGDNRNNSEDSRFADIGLVKEDDLYGAVWMIMSPFKHIKFL
jgi:signal peptidase I